MSTGLERGGQGEVRVPWWRRLLDKIEGREVVVVRGLITLVVVVAARWGVDLADIGAQLEDTLDAVAVFVGIVGGLAFQRAGATPTKEVAAQAKELPSGRTVLVAGPASPERIPDGSEVAVLRAAEPF